MKTIIYCSALLILILKIQQPNILQQIDRCLKRDRDLCQYSNQMLDELSIGTYDDFQLSNYDDLSSLESNRPLLKSFKLIQK